MPVDNQQGNLPDEDGNDDDVVPLDFLTDSAVGLSEMKGVRVASMKVWTEKERIKLQPLQPRVRRTQPRVYAGTRWL